MTRTYILVVLAAVTALLGFAYGPLVTGYVLAFAAIAALVGFVSVRIRHAIGRFSHGWSRRKVMPGASSHEERRAA